MAVCAQGPMFGGGVSHTETIDTEFSAKSVRNLVFLKVYQ